MWRANTDGDTRDDGVEIHQGYNPLAVDFKVTVALVRLQIDDDGDHDLTPAPYDQDSGEIDFAFNVRTDTTSAGFDNHNIPGSTTGSLSIADGTTFLLSSSVSFSMTVSQTLRIDGGLVEHDGSSSGTRVDFGDLYNAQITMPDNTTAPGYFQGKDLVDAPFIQFYTVTFRRRGQYCLWCRRGHRSTQGKPPVRDHRGALSAGPCRSEGRRADRHGRAGIGRSPTADTGVAE